MNPLLIYILKAGLCLAFLYLIYYTFLSRDTMYIRNRLFIMVSFISAFILPLISITTRSPHEIQIFGVELSEVLVAGMADTNSENGPLTESVSWQQILLIIYLAGIAVAGIRFAAEIVSLTLLIARHDKREERIIRINNSRTSGFSAFGFIFVDSSLSPDEALEIIKHEQKHLDRFHFTDIVIVEFLKVVQWFNPFIYLFDRSLRAVHEYQADEECLSTGIPVHSYQGLVMNQVFRTRVFNISSSFSNPTLIKKRMIMMTKKRSGWMANLKILLALPVVGLMLFLFSTCSEKTAFTDVLVEEVAPPVKAPVTPGGEMQPFVVVEEMPMYPGGDSALLRHIAENTIYPEAAKKAGVQGRVIVRFCITETGSVDKISVLKGVSPELDAESMRVVSNLGTFKPGRQAGKDVPVWYMVPITFTLSGNKTGETTAPLPPPPPPPPPPATDQTGTSSGTYVVVEEMPQFPGGNTALLEFIGKNTNYPETAKNNNITGRVIVRFVITETGKVDQITVMTGVDPELDAEAVRVCSLLPDFIPGKQGGKVVPVWYMVPITFSLK